MGSVEVEADLVMARVGRSGFMLTWVFFSEVMREFSWRHGGAVWFFFVPKNFDFFIFFIGPYPYDL